MAKTIHIRTLDASGDTELEQELTTAIQTVLDAHVQNKKWAYVGSRSFQFTATNENDPALLTDAARLREMLEESPEGIVVTLTGDLAGGAPVKVTLRVLDATGDTETIEDVASSVAKVLAAHVENKKWAYVNSTAFTFDEDALNNPVTLVAETQRLFNAVQAAGENGAVTITLTGDLAGGSVR